MFVQLYISILFFSSTAAADITPGPFNKEDCTVDQKEQEGTTCETCTNGVSIIDTAEPALEHCSAKFEETNFEYVCSTQGISYWSEVWCDGPPKESACGGCSSQGGFAGLSPFLILSCMVVGWRREA